MTEPGMGSVGGMDSAGGTGGTASTGGTANRVPTGGVDEAAVTAWLGAHVEDITPPLRYTRIAGGRSNLTYLVEDTAEGAAVGTAEGTAEDRSEDAAAQPRRWVLRRPPLGHVLATAHDVVREARILAALHPTAVPVPRIAGVCPDPTVTGAPFFVMDHVEGLICRTPATVEQALAPPARQRAGHSLLDTLVALHAVDPDAVGLGHLGRREGYAERQLRRWHTQWQRDQIRALDLIGQTHDLLRSAVPAQARTAVVHGDYRLDNCLLMPAGTVAGVLDWEICTLGDPLADLGLLLAYWAEPGDEVTALDQPPTLAGGFPSRTELLTRYLAATGADPAAVEFYVAFGWWKLACIVEGVYTRLSRGAMGDPSREDRSPASFAAQAERLATQAHTLASTL